MPSAAYKKTDGDKDAAGSSSEAKKLMWFNISGLIGTALHFATYQGLLFGLPDSLPSRVTVAWVISYLASIVWQHSLHRYLVFGTSGSYWRSLGAMYVSYSMAIVLSSMLTYVLEGMGTNEQLAYVLATGGTGIVNYYALSKSNVFE